MSKTITLLAGGTRGDVQPYLALALGLREAGYHVRMATHDRFVGLIEPWGLECVRLADNPSDLFAQTGHEQALRFADQPLRTLQATWRYWRAARPVYERLVLSAWQACQNSGAIIIGLPALWATHLSDALQIPAIHGLLQPLTPTCEFPCPLLPFTVSLGATCNRWSYRIVIASIAWAWRAAIASWRETIRLDRSVLQHHVDAPTLYGFSAQVVPRPPDWPAHHDVTGYWFLPPAPNWQPPLDLQRFLEAGDPPIYVGFGSATLRRSSEVANLITRALRDAGLRAVALRGRFNTAWPEQVFAIDDVPHQWLFPRVAVVVHHGGAGTTAAALRAGAPQIVAPESIDHFFWGRRIAALGVGAPPIGPRRFTSEALSEALAHAVHDRATKERAQQLGQVIAAEEGIARAVEIIRAWV